MNTGAILLVENEDPARAVIRRMLVAAGYTVLEAKNGVEALDVHRRVRTDLVITDVRMPQLDGLSLLDRLCADGEKPPCLVISACCVNRALPPGVGFLSKPFRRQELLDYVHLLARSTSPAITSQES